MLLLVDEGELTQEDLYSQCIHNWYSVEKTEWMINLGYMLDYVQQLKDGGWIPNDFTPTSVSDSSASSSSSNTQTSPSSPSYTQAEIDGAWVENKRVDASCSTEGYIEYKNSLTGDTKKDVLPMLEHAYEKVEKNATCTEIGIITYTCTGCADIYTEELPLVEHSYSESERVDASCTENGKIIYSCSICQNTKEEVLPALGHNGEWVVVKHSGLFSEGLEECQCVRDRAVLDSKTIPQTCPLPLSIVIVIIVSVAGLVLGIALFVKKKKLK